MDCCINDLGRFPHNEIINTGIIAAQVGDHFLYMNAPTGGTFTLVKNLAIGEALTIAIGQLNESMIYNFKVAQPDGALISVADCENFRLQTIINSQIDGCSNPCDASGPAYYGM